MGIIGHGIDLVEIDRVGQLLERHGERFLQRCFTDAERAYAAGRRRRIEHLAGRFAAKEAIFKVLGTGWGQGVAWTDAQILRRPAGQPFVELHGRGLEVAQELGIDQWWLSITHTAQHAMASAIGGGGGIERG